MNIGIKGSHHIKVDGMTAWGSDGDGGYNMTIDVNLENLTNSIFVEMAKKEYLRGFLREHLRQIFQEAVDAAVLDAVKRLTDPEDTFGQLR